MILTSCVRMCAWVDPELEKKKKKDKKKKKKRKKKQRKKKVCAL